MINDTYKGRRTVIPALFSNQRCWLVTMVLQLKISHHVRGLLRRGSTALSFEKKESEFEVVTSKNGFQDVFDVSRGDGNQVPFPPM